MRNQVATALAYGWDGKESDHGEVKGGKNVGVMDKLKGAASAMTGGAAKVSIEYPVSTVFPGDELKVRVTVVSTGGLVKSKGVFVDLQAIERVNVGTVRCERCDNRFDVNKMSVAHTQSIPISPPLDLQPNETKAFDATIPVPGGGQPTYSGPMSRHEWKIQGRIQAFGKDPDSGFHPLRVGLKA